VAIETKKMRCTQTMLVGGTHLLLSVYGDRNDNILCKYIGYSKCTLLDYFVRPFVNPNKMRIIN